MTVEGCSQKNENFLTWVEFDQIHLFVGFKRFDQESGCGKFRRWTSEGIRVDFSWDSQYHLL